MLLFGPRDRSRHINSRFPPAAAASVALFASLVGLRASALQEQGEPAPQAAAVTTQPARGEPADAELTTEALTAAIYRLETAQDLEEPVRTRLLELHQQTLAQLRAAEGFAANISDWEKATREAPPLLEQTRRRLTALTTQPSSLPPIGGTAEELEKQLTVLESELAVRKQEGARLRDQRDVRKQRREAIPGLLAEINRKLDALGLELGSTPPADESAQVTLARQRQALARKQALELEKRAYSEELRSYDARSELQKALVELAELEETRAAQAVAAWQSALNEARRAEAERQAAQAREQAESAPEAVRKLAEENELLARRLAELAVLTQKAADEHNRLAEQQKQLGKDFEVTKHRVELATKVSGFSYSESVGPFLRHARSRLPDFRALRARIGEWRAGSVRAVTEALDLEPRRQLALNVEAEFQRHVAELRASAASGRGSIDEEALRTMLENRSELLTKLDSELDRHARLLTGTADKANDVIEAATGFAAYIDTQVLWLPSSAPIHRVQLPSELQPAVRAAADLGRFLGEEIRGEPTAYVLALLVVGGLIIARPQIRSALKQVNVRAAGVYTDSFRLTLQALLYTLLLAALWPGLLIFLAWRLDQLSGLNPEAEAVALGLKRTAIALFTLLAFREICCRNGIAEEHFRWRPQNVKLFRRNLNWLLAFGWPLPFVMALTEQFPSSAWRESVGRLAFMLAMLLLSIFVYRTLRPTGGVLEHAISRDRAAWLATTRWLWFPSALLFPLILAITAALGYYYTANEIGRRVVQTIWLFLALVVAHAVVVRWLFVAQRTLAVAQFRKMRAAQAQAARESDAGEAGESPIVADEAALDLVSIDAQTRRLVKTGVTFALALGFWVIWADLLPALSFLKTRELWTHRVEMTDAAGATTVKIIPITAANVLLALVIAIATLIFGKNIPGLLEISVLQRLPLEPAGRYAITAVSRYLISVVGIVIAFGVIGVGWRDVQWLAAAITVGLGFGLQEIFANFVSGLIILFERPVRLGDTVTVGNTTGTVSRIRIRATTIVDWDRKELIIPNKEFITGQVINWTLTDTVTRLVIPVGVAYGSDAEIVRKTLLAVARNSTYVLETPKPQAIFKAFGASTLEFELRVFLRNPEDSHFARDELNTAIDEAFREAGIEIAFPQLDVHVRSTPDAPAAEPLLPAPRAVPREVLEPPRRTPGTPASAKDRPR